jgi:hypothetical protein
MSIFFSYNLIMSDPLVNIFIISEKESWVLNYKLHFI